jgi:hypothetical protein
MVAIKNKIFFSIYFWLKIPSNFFKKIYIKRYQSTSISIKIKFCSCLLDIAKVGE